MKLDEDEFEQWREHPITKLVMEHIEALRSQEMTAKKDELFHIAAHPTAWASMQPNAAFVQGQCDAFDYVVGLTLEQIETNDDK